MPEYIDLQSGQHITVMRDSGAAETGYSSTIRHLSPVGVRIDTPRRGDEVLLVRPGDDLMIMVDLQGRLFTFTSQVQQVQQASDGLVIDRPRVVDRSERRQFFRLSINIRPRYAAVIDKDGEEARRLEALITDLSGGGLQLRLRQPVQAGDLLRLVFPLGDEMLEADVIALKVIDLEGEAPWVARVSGRFDRLHRRVQEQIIRYIFRQQLAFMKRGVR